MADFDLTQTGQEVQNILDGAAMQTDLTAEVDRAELAEQTLQGNIDIEATRAKAAEKQNADDIDVIEGKIPAAASDENQLADKNFVNSSIATATATYRGAYNLVSDLSLTVDATHEQIATALAGEISTADNNDYCFVQIPTSSETPTQIASIERYKFNGSAWAYEYTLNNSGFTADQWAALNSGITSGLVAKLTALPTNDELALALAGKQNVLTFDNVPMENSNNPVKSSGVYSAIGNEETRAKAAEKANADDIDTIEEKIPAAASSENQLADKSFVNSSIATATATFKGTYNLVNDLSLTIDATHEQIAAALANEISTADNNDYCFVQIPTSIETSTQIASIERYKFNGSAWAYEYTLNNSGFTADQWAALNSGITSGLVAKLTALPTNSEIVLALAGKQDVLTFDNEPTENSNNPVKSGGVYNAIDVEATTRAAAIAAIVALIPEAASALNQLADKSFVNSSISTATAVFKGTFNVVVDLELSYNATQEQIALMLASKIIAADNNDYCFVQIPTSDETPLQIARTDRYKFNGSVWAYEYTLNNSGFTSVQWAAINSGITSLLKDKLIDLPTATELTALLAAKQNELTFDTAPTAGSTNPVTSGGVKTAIDTEATRAEAAEEALDTDKADKATTLAGYGITDAYTKSETYNKTEVNGLVSTPHQNYVTVATYASLPASGSTDTIYRVSSYDGANSQVDDTVYSEYAWDGTQYVFLCVKSQIEEVFDITVYNNNTKYADLAAALGVDGANIPATLRRGGMSVKFVQSSDNNYQQFRCKTQTFSADPEDWYFEDDDRLVENPEYICAETDKDGKLLEARENDGRKVEFGDFEVKGHIFNKELEERIESKVEKEEGKSLIDADVAATESYVENPEFIDAELDANKKMLESHENDGTKHIYSDLVVDGKGSFEQGARVKGNIEVDGITTSGKEIFEIPEISIDGIIKKTDDDPEGRIDIGIDKNKKIIHYHDSEGFLHEEAGIETPKVETNHLELTEDGMKEFEQALKDIGFQPGGGGDWTDKPSMQIPIPRLAFVNITAPNGNAVWPISKTNDYHYYMEFYDGVGNYFKKQIIFNAQGRSSINFSKKNGAADIYNNNGWDDDDTFKIKFGEWVPQDSFHFKAYYTDFFKGINVIAYKMMANIWKSRGIYKDKPYKRILLPTPEDIGYSHDTMIAAIDDMSLQIDNGARCIPDGFPAMFYLNGEFYGIYSWQLKKHRDNYHMKKDNGKHIHLDGNLNESTLFGANGNIDNIDFNPSDWAGFEIRNPKDIWTTEGEKYDADVSSRQVPVDSATAEQWIEAGVLPNGTAITSKIAKQLRYTANVRQYILTLSTYIPTLQGMRTGGSSDADIRAKIEEYFDVDSIIDYILFSSVSDNWDGFSSNWQYTTWDGVKWAICPYDMDNIFGAMEQGNVIRNYNANKFANTDRNRPSGWITTYYKAELKARWEELVQKELITPDTFVVHLMSWLDRIGENNFEKEYEKWTTTPCNRDSNENAEFWHYNGNVQSSSWTPSSDVWDANVNYSEGDIAWFKCGRWYQFTAVTSNTGEQPIKDADRYTDGSPALGFRDSIYRVINTYNQYYTTFSEFINNLNV